MEKTEARALKEENQRLKRAVEELSFLNDLARDIGASLDSEVIIKKIISSSLEAVKAEQGVITLLGKNDEPMKTLVRSLVSSVDQQQFHFDNVLSGWMQLNRQPLLINDPKNDKRFSKSFWEEEIRSILCVPLFVKSKMIGVLTIYNKRNNENFTQEDLLLLSIIAAQSAQVIETARLYEEEKKLMRFNEEMQMAAKIQHDMLPKKQPDLRGYDITGKTITASSVGGDFYDFFMLDNDRLGFVIGDVSGKGMPAALFMAVSRTLIRAMSLRGEKSDSCLKQVNYLLNQENPQSMFVTMIYGILNFKKDELEFTNAGHNPPCVINNDGSVDFFKISGNVALGVVEDFEYSRQVIKINPGTSLIFYTDGISEAFDKNNSEYSNERLKTLLKNFTDSTSKEIIDKIVEDVKKFSNGVPQSDDMTTLIIRRYE